MNRRQIDRQTFVFVFMRRFSPCETIGVDAVDGDEESSQARPDGTRPDP